MITRKSVWLAMEDKATAQRLLELARKHSKLALEHIGKCTRPERREAIRAEIECLRVGRELLLATFELEVVK